MFGNERVLLVGRGAAFAPDVAFVDDVTPVRDEPFRMVVRPTVQPNRQS
jgi:hypothetical protein